MRVVRNRQFQHCQAMVRRCHQAIRFMRRMPGWHKNHFGKIEHIIDFLGYYQVPIMDGVKSAADHTYTPFTFR